jgi:hypothetical protein
MDAFFFQVKDDFLTCIFQNTIISVLLYAPQLTDMLPFDEKTFFQIVLEKAIIYPTPPQSVFLLFWGGGGEILFCVSHKVIKNILKEIM